MATTNKEIYAYFAANPDVAAAFAQNSYGLTPDQFAATHYNLYGATEQRAQPTVSASVPTTAAAVFPSLPPPPTWTDAFNTWNTEQNLPERAAKGYTTPDMWAWKTDAEHQKIKGLLDKQYLENVRQYNAIYGTNIQPDTSVLGANAQPNQTYYSPEGGSGLFGSGIGPDVSWVGLRDNLEAAAVVAGNYVLPGSSMLTGKLVTEGAQENLNTDIGRLANAAAGFTGGLEGNLSNYGKIGEAAGFTGPATTGAEVAGSAGAASPSVSADTLAAANATSDPIAALNAIKGYTYSDLGYLSSLSGMTPEILAQATANNALMAPIPKEVIPFGSSTVTPVTTPSSLLPGSITAAQVIKALPLVPVVNQLIGDPLNLNPKPQTPTTGATGFDQVPIPTDWRSPTYQTGQAPIDLNSIFSNQNMLGGTQWQGLPNQRNLTFNDIFAAGQQQTPMGNPVNINQIVSSILGQNTASQKPA